MKTALKKLLLTRQLFRFRMDNSKGLTENLNAFNGLVQDLSSCSLDVEDETKAILLLNSLPAAYDGLRDVLLCRDTLSMDIVLQSIIAKERQVIADKKEHEIPFVRGKHRTRNNGSSKSRGKSKENTRNCYYCQKPGHYIKDCLERRQKEKESDDAAEDATPFDCYDDKAQFLSVFDSASSHIMTKDSWIATSASTHHFCMNKELFVSLDESRGGEVKMNGPSTLKIRGVGTVVIKMFNGHTRLLEEVRYVPGLISNFIAVNVLSEKGYEVLTGNGMMKVMKGNLVFVKAKKVAGLYVVSGKTEGNSES